MFTDHEVRFSPTDEPEELLELLEEITPLLRGKLQALGMPWRTLSKERQRLLLNGLGITRGSVPMICFTEIVPGRNLIWHRQVFGGYGIMPTLDWMLRNQADRVLYVGSNSPVSRQLYRIIAMANILGLHVSNNEPLFDTLTHRTTTPLSYYVEVRDNVSEVEWRIVGETSFFGGIRDTGSKIPLRMVDVDCIFTPANEVEDIQELASILAHDQRCPPPLVAPFPDVAALR